MIGEKVMFEYNEKLQCYIRTIGEMVFLCSEYKPEQDDIAQELSVLYPQKLTEIALFIKPEIEQFYGKEFSLDSIISNLGYPTFDVELNTLSYVNHVFDAEHIIIVEFDGRLERLLNTIIDG